MLVKEKDSKMVERILEENTSTTDTVSAGGCIDKNADVAGVGTASTASCSNTDNTTAAIDNSCSQSSGKYTIFNIFNH